MFLVCQPHWSAGSRDFHVLLMRLLQHLAQGQAFSRYMLNVCQINTRLMLASCIFAKPGIRPAITQIRETEAKELTHLPGPMES